MGDRITITNDGGTYLWAHHSSKGLLDRPPFAGLVQTDILERLLRQHFPDAEIILPGDRLATRQKVTLELVDAEIAKFTKSVADMRELSTEDDPDDEADTIADCYEDALGAFRQIRAALRGEPIVRDDQPASTATAAAAYLDRFPPEARPYAERAYNDGFADGAESERDAAE